MAIFYSCVKLPEVSMNQNWETPSWRFVPGGEGQWPTCWVSQKKTHVGRLLFVFQGFQVFIFQGDGLWIWNPRYSKVFQNVWFLNFLECQRYVHQHSPCYLSDQQSFRGPKVLSMCKCFEKDEKVRNRLVQLFIIRRSPKLLVSVIVSNPFCFFFQGVISAPQAKPLNGCVQTSECWSNQQVFMASCCVKSRKNSTKAVRQHCFS